MITDKTKALVATLYREGLTIAEICKRTGIRSSATIYNIVTELGIKGEKGKKRGTFSVVLTLPMELREWVEEQGDELSKLVSDWLYSRVKGLGEAKNPNLGSKCSYSRVEVLGEDEKSNLGSDSRYSGSDPLGGHQISNLESDSQYSRVEPLGEGKERISDIKTISSYTKCEPLGEPKNSDLGTTEPVRLRVVLLRNAHEVASNTILSFVDEDAVKSISLALFGNMCEQLNADEIAIYEDGGQLLWLWEIEKQSLL